MADVTQARSLHDEIADDTYCSFEDRFLRSGKGRRPDVLVPQLTNRVLVQLYDLNLRSGLPSRKVAEWFTHLYPDLQIASDRLRQIIVRTHERAVSLQDNKENLRPFLEKPFNFNFVSVDLQELGLSKSVLLEPSSLTTHRTNLPLTNAAALDLHKLQISEHQRFSFAAEWICHLLGLAADQKTIKSINRRIIKIKDKKSKLQTNKKAPPEALRDFLNEHFRDNLVVLDFSSVEASPQIPGNSLDTGTGTKLCKVEEELKLLKEKVKDLEAIIKEQQMDKCTLEAECVQSKNYVKQLKKKNEITEKTLRNSSCRHQYALKKLKENHLKELDVHKQKIESLCAHLLKKKNVLKEKSKEIKILESKLFSQSLDIAEIKGEAKNVYSDAVRETVIALQTEAGVSAANVKKVIEIVAQNIFNHSFKERLPSTQCAIDMLGEGLYISNYQVTENILKSENVTLHSDGTSRDHKKIVGHQFTVDSGETFFLGFAPVASEDAQTLLNLSIDLLHRLSFCYENVEGAHDVFKKILPKITSLMSDRAAAMKLFDKKFQEFVETELGGQIVIHFLHCNAHFLLGLSTECEKALGLSEQDFVKESGEALGRDKNAGLFAFMNDKSSATTRLIRTTCDILGPRGDQKNGCREQWTTFCDNSHIPSFKSNRFNCHFEAAAAIIFHHKKMVTFFNSGILHENPNLKIQSVSLDIQDTSLMNFVCCMAFLYVKVTGPYWMLVSKSSVQYTEFHNYVRCFHDYLEKWSANPSEIFDINFKSVFHDISLNSDYFDAIHLFLNDYTDVSILHPLMSALCNACLSVTDRQLHDFLSGDFLDTVGDDDTKIKLKHCPLTNLVGESAFGDFDFDVGKRRNASLHNRSAVHCIKRNKTMKYVSRKSPSCKNKLFSAARKFGPVLKRKHREMENEVRLKTQEMFVENQQKKIQKAMAQITKSSDIMDSVRNHGGPLKSFKDLEMLLSNHFSKGELTNVLKSEIRYQKHYLKRKLKFGSNQFMIDSLKSVLPNDSDTLDGEGCSLDFEQSFKKQKV